MSSEYRCMQFTCLKPCTDSYFKLIVNDKCGWCPNSHLKSVLDLNVSMKIHSQWFRAIFFLWPILDNILNPCLQADVFLSSYSQPSSCCDLLCPWPGRACSDSRRCVFFLGKSLTTSVCSRLIWGLFEVCCGNLSPHLWWHVYRISSLQWGSWFTARLSPLCPRVQIFCSKAAALQQKFCGSYALNCWSLRKQVVEYS